MRDVAELTGTLARVLAAHPDRPRPLSTETGYIRYDSGVGIHLSTVEKVADWAQVFDVPVYLWDNGSHVRAVAWLNAEDVAIEAWTHLSHGEAFWLLRQLGLDLTSSGVAVDPERLSTTDTKTHAG